MRLIERLAPVAALILAAGLGPACADSFLWLEERDGAAAMKWVAEQSARSRAEVSADPRFADYSATAIALATATDKLPTGPVQGGHVYNFWQDGEHILGIWRRAPVESYKLERARMGDVDRFRCPGKGGGHQLGL